MIERLRRLMPSPEQVAGNRWLRWLGPRLMQPRLWHVSRRGIALGVAIGVFFGLLIPIAQIPVSAAVAVALRANLPAAMASTLVTNPVTFPPVYFAAWKVGAALLGEDTEGRTPPVMAPPAAGATADAGWWARAWAGVTGVGQPLLLGLVLFAVCAGCGLYLIIHLAWHLRVRLKRRQRLLSRVAG